MFGRQQQLETPQAIRRTALDLLARREHSRLEMLRKLKLRGASADQCEAVIEQLQEDGLLSDERFCEAYVHARVQRGYGPQRLGIAADPRQRAKQLGFMRYRGFADFRLD